MNWELSPSGLASTWKRIKKRERKCCQLEYRRHDSSGKESLSLAFGTCEFMIRRREVQKSRNGLFPSVFHHFQDLLLYFHLYPQLSACTTNMHDSAFNSCLKAARIIYQTDTHAFLPPPSPSPHWNTYESCSALKVPPGRFLSFFSRCHRGLDSR